MALRVYVSSPYIDLADHRAAVIACLRKAGYDVNGMEDYGVFDDRPLDRCLNDVAFCDIYVGIFAHRYGSRPPAAENPDNRSITELEYRHASNCTPKKPRLIFLVDANHDWPEHFIDVNQAGKEQDAADLAAFKAEV